MGYELDGLGQYLVWKNSFLLHGVHAGSEVHPASYPMSTVDNFLGGKVAGVRS
jgi:hypothetical protein